jgi:hypothetical protein
MFVLLDAAYPARKAHRRCRKENASAEKLFRFE